MVIGNAHGSLGLTAVRDVKGWPVLPCDVSPVLHRPWQIGDPSSKNTHIPPWSSIWGHLKSNRNNYHSSFPWNNQKNSYALALKGTSQTLITSVSGTGNQYIHSQPGTWELWESLTQGFGRCLQSFPAKCGGSYQTHYLQVVVRCNNVCKATGSLRKTGLMQAELILLMLQWRRFECRCVNHPHSPSSGICPLHGA